MKRLPQEQHIRAYYKLLDSPAWCALSHSSKALWVDLRRQVGATKNGTATTAISILRHRGWSSSRHTIQRAAEELEALGLIRCTVQGGIANGGKTPKMWAFTDLDVAEFPKRGIKAAKATHDFLAFKTLEQARSVIRGLKADRAKKAEVAERRKVSKAYRKDVDSAPEARNLRVVSAHG